MLRGLASRCGGRARSGGAAAIFGHQTFEKIEHPILTALAGTYFELVNRADEHRVVGGARCGEADPRVRRRHQRLGGMEQLFLKFFPRAQADELDLDVPVWAPPGEPNHLARKVDDLDRFAHVEDENLAACFSRLGGRRQR